MTALREAIRTSTAKDPWSKGAAYVDGQLVPVSEAKVSLFDWGFNKSDVTYDVVHAWGGSFFRLDEHLKRFERSMRLVRMKIEHDSEEITEILAGCVRRTGLQDSYVAMLTTRGVPLPGLPRKPSLIKNRFFAYALPWIDVVPVDIQARGAHLIISKVPRISAKSVNPTVKNYHWGDMVKALFEAEDAGADNAILLDDEGYVTEGPGFNVFIVRNGEVLSPDRGALEGVTRLTVLDICKELKIPAKVTRFKAEDLLAADEIFLSTTAGGVMPASRIEKTIMGNDRPGPISTRIKDTYWRWHEDKRFLTPIDYEVV